MAGGGKFCSLIPSDLASLLRACLPHLRASSFFDNCMFDMCNFQGLQQMLCAHMSALTETCQDAGYVVKPWRGPQFCRELHQEAGPLPSDADSAEGRQHLRVVAQAGGAPWWNPFASTLGQGDLQSQKHALRKSHGHLQTQKAFPGFAPSCGFSRQHFQPGSSLVLLPLVWALTTL